MDDMSLVLPGENEVLSRVDSLEPSQNRFLAAYAILDQKAPKVSSLIQISLFPAESLMLVLVYCTGYFVGRAGLDDWYPDPLWRVQSHVGLSFPTVFPILLI